MGKRDHNSVPKHIIPKQVTYIPGDLLHVEENVSPLAFHPEHGLLICTLCHVGLKVTSNGNKPGQSHLRGNSSIHRLKDYNLTKVLSAEEQCEKSVYLGCDTEYNPLPRNRFHLLPPIEGVEIHEGYGCSICRELLVKSKATIRGHIATHMKERPDLQGISFKLLARFKVTHGPDTTLKKRS